MHVVVDDFCAIPKRDMHLLGFRVVGNALEIGTFLHRPAHPLICALRLYILTVRFSASKRALEFPVDS